ncbi:MAG: hypothetical protein H0U53_02995 [Actinobacteria bacterium]|nr:hypothetical protein [Actinomycetota bacterium]
MQFLGGIIKTVILSGGDWEDPSLLSSHVLFRFGQLFEEVDGTAIIGMNLEEKRSPFITSLERERVGDGSTQAARNLFLLSGQDVDFVRQEGFQFIGLNKPVAALGLILTNLWGICQDPHHNEPDSCGS